MKKILISAIQETQNQEAPPREMSQEVGGASKDGAKVSYQAPGRHGYFDRFSRGGGKPGNRIGARPSENV